MNKRYASQQGFVMLTALVFLLMLTVLAITAVRRATQDERIANNIRGQNIAFQAAETALRYCQKDFELTSNGSQLPVGTAQTVHGIPVNLYTGGPPDFAAPTLWQNKANWDASGYRLPAGTVPNVSAQPQCIIEEWKIPDLQSGGFSSGNSGNAGSDNAANLAAYMFTARGQGLTPNTVVWLQAVIYLGSGS